MTFNIKIVSLPFVAPSDGRIVFQLAGSGSVATISFNSGSTAYSLNSGNACASGALYEFSIAVALGESFTVSNATFVQGFFVPEVIA